MGQLSGTTLYVITSAEGCMLQSEVSLTLSIGCDQTQSGHHLLADRRGGF